MFRNLMATLTAYGFGTKHDIDNLTSALETTRGLLHRRKQHGLWSTNGLKLDRSFTHPPKILHFSLLPGFAHALYTTELNQTLPHGRG